MGGRRLVLLLCVVASTVALVLPTASSDPGRARSPRAFDRRAVLGPDHDDLGNGHYKVRLRNGKVVYTHGPDFAESHGMSIGPGDPERAPACATDYYQHVLYARPAAASDRYATVKAQIQASMRRVNAVLNEASLASGNTTGDYKVLCDGSGQIAVGQFTNAASSSLTDIINAATAAGFNKPNVNYSIFYDGSGPSGTCGIGTLYWDERLTSNNYNNLGGGFATSYAGCWEMIPMHENGHNMGAVQFYAPNGTGSGAHCQDEQDVMCYADGGSRFTGLIQRCTDEVKFDCGYDDYFDSAPETGEYLANHWNLGSPLNRFIKFGSSGGTPPPPPPPPPPPDPDPSSPTLTNGVAKAATSGARYSWKYYKISVPTGKTSLKVVLDGPACSTSTCTPNLNLFTRRAYKPTLASYSCAARTADSDETCTKTSPTGGYWYVGVYVYRGSLASYTIKATYP
jgi:pre-peptidase